MRNGVDNFRWLTSGEIAREAIKVLWHTDCKSRIESIKHCEIY